MGSSDTDVSGAPVDDSPRRGPKAPNAGVLLYYKYVDLGEAGRAVVKDWYGHHCEREQLRGRVRVALDGVNCTLGGTMSALERHIAGIKAHDLIRGEDIDFKLSSSKGARNSQAALESGFTTMCVKAVKEVVSMGARGADISPRQGGRHVSPEEFHGLLQAEAASNQRRSLLLRGDRNEAETGCGGRCFSPENPCDYSRMNEGSRRASGALSGDGAGRCDIDAGGGVSRKETQDEVFPASSDAREERGLGKDTVLLDVRNVYETSIGHFSVEGVETLDPKTRQFSDFPAWVDGNAERLRGKRVLMYCTGGVRCEMASAFVLQRCNNTESTGTEVMQLSGGIERYLQAYPRRDPDVYVAGDTRRETTSEGATGRFGPCEGVGVKGDVGEDREEAVMQEGLGEGFFRGKNFVFDERVSVPEKPAGGSVVGRCLLCQRPWDDYGSRSRCSRCRMLVLVCDSCVKLRNYGEDDARSTPGSNDSLSLGEILPATDGSSVPAALVPEDGKAPTPRGRELICCSCSSKRDERS